MIHSSTATLSEGWAQQLEHLDYRVQLGIVIVVGITVTVIGLVAVIRFSRHLLFVQHTKTRGEEKLTVRFDPMPLIATLDEATEQRDDKQAS